MQALMGFKSMKWLGTLLAFMVASSICYAGPFTNVEYLNGDKVFIKTPKWHEKEGDSWLFTCRLEAAAERLVKPIAHLHFYSSKGEGEEVEILWEHKSIVRRSKFDKSFGSRKANFVRVFLEDLPKDLESLTIEFKNEPVKD